VSHSGGTFAPLAVANLLQAQTQNIYVVTSEWDTQIGKQLRQIGACGGGGSFATTTMKVREDEIYLKQASSCNFTFMAATTKEAKCGFSVTSFELRAKSRALLRFRA